MMSSKEDKVVYFHLGLTKTGSSALQHFLDYNDELLLEKGYHYIRTLRDKYGNHNQLAHFLYHRKYNLISHKSIVSIISQRDFLLNKLAEEISTSSSPAIIISSESLLLTGPEIFPECVDLISSVLPKAKIVGIVYIRNIIDWIHSQAAETIKIKHLDTYDDRLFKMNFWFNVFFKNFKQAITMAASVLGKDKLIFRKYDQKFFVNGNIFSDFLDAIGLKLTNEYTLHTELVNKSLKYCETLYMKDHLNHLELPIPEEKVVRILFDWEASNQGIKFMFPKIIRPEIEKSAINFSNFMLTNFLSQDFEKLLVDCRVNDPKQEFILTHKLKCEMLNYLDSKIKGFKEQYYNSVLDSLDKAYLYNLHCARIKTRLKKVLKNRRCALWGCGAAAEELFTLFDVAFQELGIKYAIDANPQMHRSQFRDLEIIPPALIPEIGIDTILVTSVQYANVIIAEVKNHYPTIHSIIKLGGLIDFAKIDLRSTGNVSLRIGNICSYPQKPEA